MPATNYQISPPATVYLPTVSYGATGSYHSTFITHVVRVYSYLDTSYGRIYSGTYRESGSFVDNGGGQEYNIPWKWGTVSGRTGYRILEYASGGSHTFNHGTISGTEIWTDSKNAVTTQIEKLPTSILVSSENATFSDSFLRNRKTVLTFNEIATFSDLIYKEDKWTWFEQSQFSDILHINPRKLPTEICQCFEDFQFTSTRNATISNWNFAPDYKIFLSNDGIDYATTNWDVYAQGLGNIKKTVKHWTGNYEVGNWELELNNPENIIWGSFYGSNNDARYKYLLIRAMICDKPFTYVNQFGGEIQDVNANSGKLTITVKDLLLGLSNNQFTYDYDCLGSSNEQGQWGIVKYIIGTNVMFDDRGYSVYIERKSPETTFGESLLSGIIGAGIGFIAGGFTFGIGAGLGFAGGFLGNSPQDSRTTGGYYRITDFNAIPDDTVKSGVVLKFYKGSVSGNAENGNGILSNLTEYPIVSGHFESGVYGTFAFADVQGVNIGDYVYVRKPLYYDGSPNDIIKAMLCGSNINNPYSYGQTATISSPMGMQYVVMPNNFGSTWDDELNAMELLGLSRLITPDENLNPFDLVKELLSEIKVSFYINEENKFACKSIRPIKLSNNNIATYSEGINILENFNYKMSTEEVQAGMTYLYAWTGGGYGAYGDYNKRFVLPFPNSIGSKSLWGTVQSKWLHNIEDIETLSYRIMMDTERGVNRAELPTTLYGVTHNLSDYLRIATHRTGSIYNRLFEIESYTKTFDKSTVDLSLVDVNNLIGYGNCKWLNSFGTINPEVSSGHSYYGQIASMAGSLTTLNRAMDAWGTEIPIIISIDAPSAGSVMGCKGWYCCFGSLTNQRTELFYVEDALIRTRWYKGEDIGLEIYKIIIRRGLFDTISRPVPINSIFYSIVPASKDSNGNLTTDSLAGKFNLGTSLGINPLYGTIFRFF